MVTVYSGRDCLGFIIERGREGFEAHMTSKSVRSDFFKTQQDAAVAVMRSQSGFDDGR
jgi:hypothetical protein